MEPIRLIALLKDCFVLGKVNLQCGVGEQLKMIRSHSVKEGQPGDDPEEPSPDPEPFNRGDAFRKDFVGPRGERNGGHVHLGTQQGIAHSTPPLRRVELMG